MLFIARLWCIFSKVGKKKKTPKNFIFSIIDHPPATAESAGGCLSNAVFFFYIFCRAAVTGFLSFSPTSCAFEEWGWSIEKLNSDPIISTFLEGFAAIMSLKNLYPAGLFSLPKVFSWTSCLLIVLSFSRLSDIWLQLFFAVKCKCEPREALCSRQRYH